MPGAYPAAVRGGVAGLARSGTRVARLSKAFGVTGASACSLLPRALAAIAAEGAR